MSKWMAVVALGAAMICGCDSMKKKDKESSEPKKMSTSADKCTSACDGSAAKAK